MSRAFSVEDTRLNQRTLVTSRNKIYKDIDLSFINRPSGDVYKKQDAGAVKQAVRTLLLTNRFEKPFQPGFGANLRSLLFELVNDPDLEVEIEEQVRTTVARYEPRAEVLNVRPTVRPDNNEVSVTVTFKVINTEEVVTFTTVFSRLR